MSQTMGHQNIWSLIASGGFAMYPLILCSLLSWAVVLERLWSYRRLGRDLKGFHLEALNSLLRGERDGLANLCHRNANLPTAHLLLVALERLNAKDERLRMRWQEAVERRRQLLNQELRQNLWILGTIGSASPFIGLFGTVVGILSSFQEMARSGSGGFNVVAAGISESLIATAAGIVVAVIAVMAFNAFQTRWSSLVLMLRVHTEELVEMLQDTKSSPGPNEQQPHVF
ncbi:MAG TPA: MotA/TolQ/ExbB proton channel family protein [Bdellovibrionota bacterium]|nr:MotA/TolQ/ExbB proton channel family protein [Bdellovibrionota bacterium]